MITKETIAALLPGQTQREIAEHFKVSQPYIARLCKRWGLKVKRVAHNLKDDFKIPSNSCLEIIELHSTKNRRAKWLCKCRCGNQVVVDGKHLRSGLTKSCGCLKKIRSLWTGYGEISGGYWASVKLKAKKTIVAVCNQS